MRNIGKSQDSGEIAPSQKKKPPLGAQDWIEAAWAALALGSVEFVKIDRLARSLEASRGSFYWHFDDRRSLIRALFTKWQALVGLDRELEEVEVENADPVGVLTHIAANAIQRVQGAQSIALRLLAKEDAEFGFWVAEEDSRRIRFFRAIFVKVGLDGKSADARARIFHALLVSEYLRAGELSLEERTASIHASLTELTARNSEPSHLGS